MRYIKLLRIIKLNKENNMSENCGCSRACCEVKLKDGCISHKFYKPCCAREENKTKVCCVCKAEYACEYDECPSCSVSAE
ncbi:hypothetical protein AGMMS50222_03060 [Endomicrobiia bacterium]|nr:hypothetical protein AGMMS49531_04500 [Endomicrobiia bacterium]GHT63899.1 hypothetical protein AGMMS49556_01110 [Endomicrobiia bacterium]GHT74243.1 hypothetical protein AGMMS50222_03060 [Endomicrobiia bacterium]